MSPDAQRIAIAEACPKVAGIRRGVPFWHDQYEYEESAGSPSHKEFDPLNDLNAMHEAEKVLTYNQCKAYIEHLSVQSHDTMRLGKACEFAENFAFHATAAQRAEAFLRTLGKWEDGK